MLRGRENQTPLAFHWNVPTSMAVWAITVQHSFAIQEDDMKVLVMGAGRMGAIRVED